jgi:excisionase family DNA binding protein
MSKPAELIQDNRVVLVESIAIEFFSPKTLAKRWSKSRSHIYDLIAEGKLRRSKWGRSVMIHRTEVEHYELEMRKCEPMDTTSAITEAATVPSSTLAVNGEAAFRLARSTARAQSKE